VNGGLDKMRLPRFQVILKTGFWISVIGLAGIPFSPIIMILLGLKIEYVLLISKIMFLLGIFITSYAFVQRGLEKFGAVNFGFSAFISIIGFLLLYFPTFSLLTQEKVFAVPNPLETVLVIAGIVLIIFGLLTEQFNLNRKIAKQFMLIINSLKKVIKKINLRRIYHPSNILSIIAIVFLYLQLAKNYFSFINQKLTWFTFGILIALNLFLQFPKEIFEIINSTNKIIYEIAKYFVEGIKNLPHYLKILVVDVYQGIVKTTLFVVYNDYVLLPFIGFGIVLFSDFEDQLKMGIIFLSILIAMFRMLVAHPKILRKSLSYTRSQVHKYSVRVRYLVRRNEKCAYCHRKISAGTNVCPYCGREQIRDMISNTIILLNEPVRQCPHCHNYGKTSYLDNWLKYQQKCPYCKQPFNITDSPAKPLEQYLMEENELFHPINQNILEEMTRKTKEMFSPRSHDSNVKFRERRKTIKTQKKNEEDKQEALKKAIAEETKKAISEIGIKALTGQLDKNEIKKVSKKALENIKKEIEKYEDNNQE